MPESQSENIPAPPEAAPSATSISDGFTMPFREKGEYGAWLREGQVRQFGGSDITHEARKAMAAVERMDRTRAARDILREAMREDEDD